MNTKITKKVAAAVTKTPAFLEALGYDAGLESRTRALDKEVVVHVSSRTKFINALKRAGFKQDGKPDAVGDGEVWLYFKHRKINGRIDVRKFRGEVSSRVYLG